MALTSIKANGMRSLLTMLGIIIGVGAVVAMVALGDGVKAQTTDSFGELGANTLNIMPEGGRNRGVRQARSAMQSLKTMDAEAIEKKVKGVQYVSPVVSSSYQVVYGNENVNTNVRGVKPAYLQKNSITVKNGYFITNDANENRLRVAVLGNTVAVNLFGEDNPVGKQIRINNQPFRVIGIMDTTGASGMGEDQDEVILVTFTTLQERMLGITHIQRIEVTVEPGYSQKEVGQDIINLLRSRHHLTATQDDDFRIIDMSAILKQMEDLMSKLSLFVTLIAAISLLVGGIGIMNIMMVSVTERTREIGIRKALGATFSNIMIQFLIESMVLSGIGGIIGIMLGCAISKVVPYIVPQAATLITVAPIIISFLFSMAVGLFFGIYPARKAAKLDPIEALRYE